MTVKEAAAALGLSHKTLQAQIHNGKLRASKIGPILWITPAEVARYARENRRKR
jgi:excisionase family DNA binding protein